MKIFVVSRSQIKRFHKKDPSFHKNNWIISIFSSDLDGGCDGWKWNMNGMSSNSYSPLPNAPTVLKLQFDDVTEKEGSEYIHFTSQHAKKIVDFLKKINDDGSKNFFVHCDAGVSRSGAVGMLLNEWFNKYLANNSEDDNFFKVHNSHIRPNPEVTRILKIAMFGTPFMGIKVNDFEFNDEGERVDHVEEI